MARDQTLKKLLMVSLSCMLVLPNQVYAEEIPETEAVIQETAEVLTAETSSWTAQIIKSDGLPFESGVTAEPVDENTFIDSGFASSHDEFISIMKRASADLLAERYLMDAAPGGWTEDDRQNATDAVQAAFTEFGVYGVTIHGQDGTAYEAPVSITFTADGQSVTGTQLTLISYKEDGQAEIIPDTDFSYQADGKISVLTVDTEMPYLFFLVATDPGFTWPELQGQDAAAETEALEPAGTQTSAETETPAETETSAETETLAETQLQPETSAETQLSADTQPPVVPEAQTSQDVEPEAAPAQDVPVEDAAEPSGQMAQEPASNEASIPGSGTEEDPYVIQDAAGLAAFQSSAGQPDGTTYVKVTGDILLEDSGNAGHYMCINRDMVITGEKEDGIKPVISGINFGVQGPVSLTMQNVSIETSDKSAFVIGSGDAEGNPAVLLDNCDISVDAAETGQGPESMPVAGWGTAIHVVAKPGTQGSVTIHGGSIYASSSDQAITRVRAVALSGEPDGTTLDVNDASISVSGPSAVGFDLLSSNTMVSVDGCTIRADQPFHFYKGSFSTGEIRASGNELSISDCMVSGNGPWITYGSGTDSAPDAAGLNSISYSGTAHQMSDEEGVYNICSSLQDAVEYAGSNDSVILGRSETDPVTVSKPLTIYKNGNTASFLAGNGLTVSEDEDAYLVSGEENKTSDDQLLISDDGLVTLHSGHMGEEQVYLIQLSLGVQPAVETADVSFVFNPGKAYALKNASYKKDTGLLTVYIQYQGDMTPIIEQGQEEAELGTVTVLDSKGRKVQAQIHAAGNALSYMSAASQTQNTASIPETDAVLEGAAVAQTDRLKELVAQAKELDGGDSQAFADALREAEALLAEELTSYDQDLIDSAADLLSQEMQALSEAKTDTSALEELISKAEGLSADAYTEESWKTMLDALMEAKGTLADSAADQEQIDDAADALRLALSELEEMAEETEAVDFSALKTAVSYAEALRESDYTEESWEELAEAVDLAHRALATPEGLTQQTVDEITAAVNDAYNGLVKQAEEDPDPDDDDETNPDGSDPDDETDPDETDSEETEPETEPEDAEASYTKLAQAILEAEGLSRDDYTDTAWKELKKALKNARKAMSYTDQRKIDLAAVALENAMAAMDYRTADYDLLNAVIRKAESLNEADYTSGTWAVFLDALADAKALRDDLDLRYQKTVDSAATALNDAMNSLVMVQTENAAVQEESVGAPQTGDRSFLPELILFSAGLLLLAAGVFAIAKQKRKSDK